MSEQNQPQPQDTDVLQSGPLNPGRRRLGTLGAGGTAIALSVTSRSAVAGWGSCSKSELASGNLSRDMSEANPCGCSPGYWWNNNGKTLWADPTVTAFATFRSSALFNSVFGCNFLSPNKSLANCGPSTNPANTCDVPGNTAMHAIAALLNAAYYGNRYPVVGMTTPAGVITAFKNAFAAADRKKAFSEFVLKVDIYSSKPTWCQSKSHGGV